jgi:hypothetical protein
MVTTDEYSDIPIPTGDDWSRIGGYEGKFFGYDCNSFPTIDKFNIKWKDKKPTAVFRGASTGCGVTIDTNVDWYGYSSGGWADPTNPYYSYMMDKYISYSGFTLGSDGNFMTPVSSFNGLIKQSPGIGTDGYGCSINQYTFETITISNSNINPNEYYFYSVWIPLSGVGGVMDNMTIGVGYMSYPCSFDFLLTPATTISSTNITVTSGAAIPAGVYRVLYCSSSMLLPPSTPSTNNFYFKGDTKS